MRTGFKVVSAGLALVIGCSTVAISPLDLPILHSNSSLATAAANSAEAREAHEAPNASAADEGGLAQSDDPLPAAGPRYKDGTYRSSGDGKFGAVGVRVTVTDGKIAKIALEANSEAAPMVKTAQDVVVPQILETQSVDDIDMATGATLTSEAIVEAVAKVLRSRSGVNAQQTLPSFGALAHFGRGPLLLRRPVCDGARRMTHGPALLSDGMRPDTSYIRLPPSFL